MASGAARHTDCWFVCWAWRSAGQRCSCNGEGDAAETGGERAVDDGRGGMDQSISSLLRGPEVFPSLHFLELMSMAWLWSYTQGGMDQRQAAKFTNTWLFCLPRNSPDGNFPRQLNERGFGLTTSVRHSMLPSIPDFDSSPSDSKRHGGLAVWGRGASEATGCLQGASPPDGNFSKADFCSEDLWKSKFLGSSFDRFLGWSHANYPSHTLGFLWTLLWHHILNTCSLRRN